jgi:kanamycin nucleotidyltransferase
VTSSLPAATLDELFAGPQLVSREARRALAARIVECLKSGHGGRLIAVAVYGSVALDADGPYSDLEVWAAVADCHEAPGVNDRDHEWVWGPGKAEVNVMSESVMKDYVAEVEASWPLTHGQFVHARALYEAPGREGFVAEMRRRALDVSDADRDEALAKAVVGDIYELVGKLRNAAAMAQTANVARLVCTLAAQAACLVALHRRHSFRSDSTLLEEAAILDGPDGQAELLRLVAEGALQDAASGMMVAERYWSGVRDWAEGHGLDLDVGCPPLGSQA